MAKTSIEHAVLTVTDIGVFVETMRYLHEQNLWDDALAHLESQGKTTMLIDAEAFGLLGAVLLQREDANSNALINERIRGHLGRIRGFLESLSGLLGQ